MYVLANEGMPGALKIGSTTRNPFTRAKELQTTGVPHPFVVVAAVRVSNASAVEKAVHRELARRDLRINGDREFFSADLAVVLGVMATLCAEGNDVGGGAVEARTGDDALSDAIAFRDGVGNQPPDMKKALLAFEEAAALGSRHADYVLMQLYSGGREVRKSSSKMIFYKNKVEKHIADLKYDEESIIDLPQMYCGPSVDDIEEKEQYELYIKTMLEHKHYQPGLRVIERFIEKFGFKRFLLPYISTAAYCLGGQSKRIWQRNLLQWISIDEVAQHFISRINSIVNKQVYIGQTGHNIAVFSGDPMVFETFDYGSMFGTKFASVLRGIAQLTYSDIERRPKIQGKDSTALGKWLFGDSYF